MSDEKHFHVYIIASRPCGALYVGVTSDLIGRIAQHKAKTVPGFSARYGCDCLVYFEGHETAEAAITREKQIKEWQRGWKINLIERGNPHWLDLYDSITR